MGEIIGVVNKKGEDATETAVAMLQALKLGKVNTFGMASSKTIKKENLIKALQSQNLNSSAIIGQAFSKILVEDKPQPIMLKNASLIFDGRIYSTEPRAFAVEIIAKRILRNCEKFNENIMKSIEGDFVFLITQQERILAGRDVMGNRPLYYGENNKFAALASQRKALWSVGITKVKSFPPGHIAFISDIGFRFKCIKKLVYSKPKQMTMQTAREKLQKLLQISVNKRILGLKEVAVAFSGGLDSSILAFLANKKTDVNLIHVSMENGSETEYAKQAAEQLNLPIHVHFYNEENLKKILAEVLWLIEEPNPVNTSIGIPMYWTANAASKMGFKVMLAGQGADELFGGYRRYVSDYLKYGGGKLHKIFFGDIIKMHETNFERDCKICSFHNVELRLPFATFQIAKFATNLPIELKIERCKNGLRKLVLRKAAEAMGLPQFIVNQPKKAIQYTTGVNKALKKLAKKENMRLGDYLEKKFQENIKKEEYG